MMDDFFSGRVAIITGASKGIGRAVAERFAALGVHLILNARTETALNVLRAEIQTHHPKADIHLVPGDIADPDTSERLAQAATQGFGRLDFVINNAGIAGKIALLQEISIEEINATLNTNLKGPIFLMRATIPLMVQQQSGSIININSVAGKTAYPFWSVYDASKFGLRAITEAVAEEQRSNNIRVIGLYPGAVDTPLWESIELNHEPNRANMLSSETIADSIVYILQQPAHVLIQDITLTHVTPAL